MKTIFLFLIAAAGFVGSVAWADDEIAAAAALSGLGCHLLD